MLQPRANDIWFRYYYIYTGEIYVQKFTRRPGKFTWGCVPASEKLSSCESCLQKLKWCHQLVIISSLILFWGLLSQVWHFILTTHLKFAPGTGLPDLPECISRRVCGFFWYSSLLSSLLLWCPLDCHCRILLFLYFRNVQLLLVFLKFFFSTLKYLFRDYEILFQYTEILFQDHEVLFQDHDIPVQDHEMPFQDHEIPYQDMKYRFRTMQYRFRSWNTVSGSWNAVSGSWNSVSQSWNTVSAHWNTCVTTIKYWKKQY